MSEATTVTETHDDHHPSDWEYVKIAGILAVLTTLFVLMIVKFWLVARMFMHLKQDKPILSQSFAAGLALATGVYIVALLAFNFFSA